MTAKPYHISDIPNGFDVIQSMIPALATEYIGDELNELYHNTQTYLDAMRDSILLGDDLEAGRIFRECLVAAGNAARDGVNNYGNMSGLWRDNRKVQAE